MEKRGNAAKYPLRRRLSATSGSKIVSVYNGGAAVDFADRAKKPRRWQEEEHEEEVVVEGAERQTEASDGHRASQSSPDVDTQENIGASQMVDVSEGEEATRHPKRVAKIHNHGKALDDCNTVDPATVPRKLRSAMNKRNRESISPPLPESRKCNGSNGSRLTPLRYSNGIKKSRQSLKQANAMDRSPRKPVPLAVTKTEEEVAEALYDLSRMFNGSPARNKAEETEIEEIKPLPSPEERTNKLPLDSPAEDANKCEQEMVDASADDVLTNPVEVKTSAELTTIIAQPPAAIRVPEELDLESHVLLDQLNNTQFEKKSSVLPLTDVSNVLVPPRGDSEKGLIQLPISDLLPPDQAEKGPLQSEIFVAKRLELSENPEKCASLGSMPGVAPLSRRSVKNGSHIDLDLSGLSSTKTTALGDSTRKVAKSAVSTGKCPDSAKQTRKRCAIHVHLSHFIRSHQNDSKLPKWAVLSWQQPPKVNGDAQKAGTSSVYNHSISSIPTADSTVERNPNSGCLQLLQEKIPALDGLYSRETQGINFLSLSPSGGDGAKLRSLNSGVVESTLPAPSSFMGSVQHQRPFSIQPAQLHTAYTDQQLAATAAQQVQVQFQVQLPQYIANPFLNPHFAAAAAVAAAATTPAGKQQHQQRRQLWLSQMAQYHQAAQVPKWSNGRNDVASLFPSGQPGPSLDPLNNTFAQNQQLFPLTSAPNKKQQQPQLRQQIFRSEGPSQLQLLSNGDRT